LLLLLLLVVEGILAQEVTVEELDNNSFRLSFSSTSTLAVEAAQVRLLPTALELCGDILPSFGRYSSSRSEPIVGDRADAGESFAFEQEITCTSAVVVAEERADLPQALSSDEVLDAQRLIRRMSTEYFENIANERYEEAYSVVAESLREYSTAESWTLRKQAFRAEVGAAVAIVVARITVYQNPQNAPGPGIYIAADFNNEFERAPIHCGYLMWFLDADGEYRITREETGHVTTEILATIPSEQIPIIRERMLCISPPEAELEAAGL
jgi:hypothetical protein